MYVPPPAPPPPNITRAKLKSLAFDQERHLQNFATDIKFIEQVNTSIRATLGDLLRALPRPLQARDGKNVTSLEPSTKFSGPITEARYLINLAQDAQHSP